MAEYRLEAIPTLGGITQEFQGIRLCEATDLALVSLAFPRGDEAGAEAAITAAFGVDTPPVGASVVTAEGARLLRLGLDQVFVLFDHKTPDAERHISARLAGAVYTTDQTDVWVSLEISGTRASDVLERICPIDLDPNAFAVERTARTSMEHLGTIITRTGADDFLLLSARSSARSFLHMIETSIANVF